MAESPLPEMPAEGPRLEYVETLDPTDPRDRLVLVEEVVAFANAGGGRIVVGVTNAGTKVGVPVAELDRWDPADIRDLIGSFVVPDRIDVTITSSTDPAPDGPVLVTIDVPRFESPPLVFSRDGDHDGEGGPVFRRHSVVVRHRKRAEPARRSDYLKWREDLRSRILDQFRMVLGAPESAHLRMVRAGEVRDEPDFLLSRAVDLFRRRPEKLLDSNDLLHLFRNRATVELSAELVPELLIHSSLRRRATLFFWLALAEVDAARVAGILRSALGMRDRDKSDMAGVVPLVAALYLTRDAYAELIELMAQSSYAHICGAAGDFPTIEDARAAITERRKRSMDGLPLAELADDRLLAEATILAEGRSAVRASRRMPNLGLEYLARRLEVQRA